MSKANEPAFPVHGRPHAPGAILDGLTKREYFAALAMQGMCGLPSGSYSYPGQLAIEAVETADALLAELAKSEAR